MGLESEDIEHLKECAAKDAEEGQQQGFGQNVMQWMANAVQRVGGGSVDVAKKAAGSTLAKLLVDYFAG